MLISLSRKIRYGILGVALAAFAAALLYNPERYIAVCFDGIKMWAVCVLPAIFPFMVICALLTNTGIAAKISAPFGKLTKIFRLPSAAAPCIAMSLISGYPAGSRVVSEFYTGRCIDENGARKLACLCSATGPLFAIGTVGVNMLNSAYMGVKLYFAHIIAVLTVGIIFSFFKPTPKGTTLFIKRGNALNESFYGSVNAVLTAGAFIVFFYTAAAVIADFNLFYPLERLLSVFFGNNVADAVCTGIVEMTGGCAALAKTDSRFTLPLTGFLVTFGGVCILLQQLCYLTVAKVKPLPFILQKFLQGLLCFLILLVIG